MASVDVRVTPRAAGQRIGPYADGILLMRVTRPPADGQANRAVRSLLAKALSVPPTSVRQVAGERSRHKRFEIEGLDEGELRRRLEAAAGD